MSDVRDLMLTTLDRVMDDTLTTAAREKADGNGLSAVVWAALEEQGMTALGDAGNDIGYSDAMALVQRAAYHAAPVPLGEAIAARRLLSAAGIAVPDEAVTLSMPRAKGLSGMAWGRDIGLGIVATENGLQLVEHKNAIAYRGQNQAGEPRDDIDLSKARIVAEAALPGAAERLKREGALIRSVQLAGALDRTLEHCLTWVNDRVQFGKPLARFQAIQHSMAVMASEVAAAKVAVEMAVEASDQEADAFAVGVAKSRAGEAAGKVAAAAHAAFGAMGFTREHSLHYSTRRLWAWRDEFGGETYWQAQIGREIAAGGGARLWGTLTARG
jgi:acyl-CoA dehydrogenase